MKHGRQARPACPSRGPAWTRAEAPAGRRQAGNRVKLPCLRAGRRPRPGAFRLQVIDPALLVGAYSKGLFPMALEDGHIGWFSPDPRGVLPLDTFRIPARLARVVRQDRFEIAIDRDFAGVMRACAERPDEGTWISAEILDAYERLHALGIAHSVETWQDDRLVGGLYGVHLGGAFFGESMFHRVPNASKVALVVLVDRLRERGFTLLDIQWVTPHLVQFGAVEIARTEYLRRLQEALAKTSTFA